MNIQPSCVLSTVNSIPAVVSNGIFENKHEQSTPQQVLYLVSLDQDDGTSQLVQITEEQATALGICRYDSSENNTLKTVESSRSNSLNPIRNVKHLNTDRNNAFVKILHSPPKPIGSCENSIKIIKNGQKLHSTQNFTTEYIQQIAKALQDESNRDKDVVEEYLSDMDDGENIVYRVMFPDELNLKPSQTKRGRPKKSLKDSKRTEKNVEIITDEQSKPVQNVRTRSGRITRPPRHIKKDFSKIDTSEPDNNESEIKVVEFEPLKTNQSTTSKSPFLEIERPITQKRKRAIASQYRCPTCKKAYLGHTRMLKHIQIHPDHGPVPDNSKTEENDTWNYLIDISNTTSVGRRGMKFCKQLISLLHNVQLMAKLLFKRPSVTDKNVYFIDSILSKILGIDSGNYTINESQLQRDVNILKFITDNASTSKCLTNEETSAFDLQAYVEKNTPHIRQTENKRLRQNEDLSVPDCNSNNLENVKNGSCHTLSFDEIQSDNANIEIANNKLENLNFHQELEFKQHITTDFANKHQTKLVDTAMDVITSCDNQQSNIKATTNDFSLQSDLLSDNSLLNSLPTLRTPVEELLLSNVDNTQVTNLLDNSTSSDDVMNVDQFVNERFKNFTESDIELPNPPLSLDLPSLDLFQFHSS